MANAGLSRASDASPYWEDVPERRRQVRENAIRRRNRAVGAAGKSPKEPQPKPRADSRRPKTKTAVKKSKTKSVVKKSAKSAVRKSARPAARSTYVRPWEKVAAPVASGPVSEQTKRNRERAFKSNFGMVVLLGVAMVALMFIAVQFLQNKAEYTATLSKVAELETQLSDLKEDNDAYYNSLNTNVDLSGLKKRALSQLGMNNPTEAQVETYTSPEGTGFMRQYQDAPD